MQRTTISVIIPTYNAAKYLNASIQSVLSQTFKDFELLIIDDGSTDNTKEIISAYDDSRLKYFYQSNHGKSYSRNKGIFESTGEFICFLDADDFYYENKLRYLFEFLNDNPQVGCAAGATRRISENGRTIFRKTYNDNRLITVENLLFGNPITICSTLIRTKYVKKIEGFDTELKRGEDWDFHYRLALSGCAIIVKNNIVCAYRYRQNAVDKTNEIYCRNMIEVSKKMFGNKALPDKLKELRNDVLSTTYLRLSARCYASNNMSLGKENLQKAIHYDRRIIENNQKKILTYFVNWIRNFDVTNVNDLIKQITKNLPDECKALLNNTNLYSKLKFMIFLGQLKQNTKFVKIRKHVRIILLKILRVL